MCVFLKGGQVYPVPPSLKSRRFCCRLTPPLLMVGGDALLDSGEWGVRGLSLFRGEGWRAYLKRLSPRAILPLRPLYDDLVRWHP